MLAGDLNVYDQTSDLVMKERWRAILHVVESLGLVNLAKHTRDARGPLEGCPCRDPGCYHITTFRHRSSKPGSLGFMNDYMFASPDLADRLTSFEVIDRPDVWEMSDHAPLVGTFDLS